MANPNPPYFVQFSAEPASSAQIDHSQAAPGGATHRAGHTAINFRGRGGLTWQPINALTTSIDFYQIKIKDRIVLSSNYTGTAVTNFLVAQGLPAVGGGPQLNSASTPSSLSHPATPWASAPRSLVAR